MKFNFLVYQLLENIANQPQQSAAQQPSDKAWVNRFSNNERIKAAIEDIKRQINSLPRWQVDFREVINNYSNAINLLNNVLSGKIVGSNQVLMGYDNYIDRAKNAFKAAHEQQNKSHLKDSMRMLRR